MQPENADLRSRMKIGLEIHFQVSDGKLFCRCPTDSDGKEIFRFRRRLVATSSEMGSVDLAAKYEMERNLLSEYSATDNSCLVEYDEEPPHEVDRKAMQAAIIASIALNCNVLRNIFFMRKVVVDGSNTSGFQRTAVISMNGHLHTSRGDVGISSICLEEDSARLLGVGNGMSTFSLDRLGIPLVEIATDPDIVDEDHAVETAKAIGYLVQATGLSRMTVDAIRQDVNVSFGYGRVEIKGVQKLSLIPEVIQYELQRQQNLLEISRKASMHVDYYLSTPVVSDVTPVFERTESKIISRNLAEGNRVYGCILRGLDGLMKNGSLRMGKEISDLVRRYGIRGLFHSDELPGYGMTREETDQLYSALKRRKDDAAMIISCPEPIKEIIFQEIFARIAKLLRMDLTETRLPVDDGTTAFLRPMPGRERMYPETDVPVISVTENEMQEQAKKVPVPVDEKISQISGDYGISPQDAMVLVNSFRAGDFEEMCSLFPAPKTVARLILQIIPELERKHGTKLPVGKVYDLLKVAGERNWIRDVIEKAAEIMISEHKAVTEILERDELSQLGQEDLIMLIKDMFSTNPEELSEKSVVAKLKMSTKRPFSASDAIQAYRLLDHEKIR